jgi:hypothetical protein
VKFYLILLKTLKFNHELNAPYVYLCIVSKFSKDSSKDYNIYSMEIDVFPLDSVMEMISFSVVYFVSSYPKKYKYNQSLETTLNH